MPQAQPNNITQRILNFSVLIIFVSTFIVFFIGVSLFKIRTQNLETEQFLELTQNVKPNFERSLQLYTENTEDAITFVHELRPDSDVDYVRFIQSVEELSVKLGLNLDIESRSSNPSSDSSSAASVIDYDVTFFGGMPALNRFLEELERLPYFIRVRDIDYRNISFLVTDEERSRPNVSLSIQLHAK